MERSVYEMEASVVETHWWFRGRRQLFTREIRRAGVTPTARVLDIGISAGSNLQMFRELEFADIFGLERSDTSLAACRARGFQRLIQGDALALPFRDEVFDLVMLTDVVEHLDDDRAAMAEAWRVLKEGGLVLVTVPAFMSLWGLQDELSHHRRRYRKSGILGALLSAPFKVERQFYFNYLLFLPIWAARTIMRRLGLRATSENAINSAGLNAVLTALFGLDVLTAPWIRPPFGVSAYILARKQGRDLAGVKSADTCENT